MKVLVNYLQDDRKTITESVLYDSTELDHILTEGDLAMLNNGDTIEMIYEGVPCTLSLFKERVDHYYWLGYLGNYEVKGFMYDEDTKVLTLYTYTDVKEDIRTIVDLSYADSSVQLDTFTDEEINEHLLEAYEEYVHEDDLPIRLKEEK